MAQEYLVAFGRAGHLGRFASDFSFSRGDCVVIRGRRGLEVGQVLHHASGKPAVHDEFIGDILRTTNAQDITIVAAQTVLADRLCAEAEATSRELSLPITILDCEFSLDGASAILHGLTHAPCDAGPLLEQLGERHNLIIRWYDLTSEPQRPADALDHEESFKCDKPDCGEGHCDDCGDGCTSCSAGSAKDLQAYFADLREKMPARVRLC